MKGQEGGSTQQVLVGHRFSRAWLATGNANVNKAQALLSRIWGPGGRGEQLPQGLTASCGKSCGRLGGRKGNQGRCPRGSAKISKNEELARW